MKFLQFTPPMWDELSWDLQRTFLEGMSDDEDCPFTIQEGPADFGGAQGPTIRENVDAGTDVIDLAKMRDELEALRVQRKPA